jgi:hypothetical protein
LVAMGIWTVYERLHRRFPCNLREPRTCPRAGAEEEDAR